MLQFNVLYRWAVPRYFYEYSGKVLPWLLISCLVCCALGLWGACIAPADYQQGDGFRILYVHVPAAFLSLSIYAGISVMALMVLVWNIKMADVLIQASALVGAWVTFLALLTGSLWGKPMWGAFWVWDARLTSELILLLLYLGIMALREFFPHRLMASKACAVFTLIGAIDLPIIHYSVQWWTTLHQGSTVRFMGPSLMDPQMLWPLWWMMGAYAGFVVLWVLVRARALLLELYPSQVHWQRGKKK